jgi:hypothetical protein
LLFIYDGSVTTLAIQRVGIYLNGVAATTSVAASLGSFPFDLSSGTAHLGLGDLLNRSGVPCNVKETTFYAGDVDDLAIWTRTLSSEEAVQVYQRGVAGNGLLWWSVVVRGEDWLIRSLGRERTFLLFNRDSRPSLPSDLAGVTALTFGSRADSNLRAAVAPARQRMREHTARLGLRPEKRLDQLAEATASVRGAGSRMQDLVRLLARSRKVDLDVFCSQFEDWSIPIFSDRWGRISTTSPLLSMSR